MAVALYGLLGMGAAARAQQVLSPPPAYQPAPSAGQEGGQVSPPGFGPALSTIADPTLWLNWGPVSAHPHASYFASYTTGVNSAPGQANDSFIQTISPGVLMNIGTHWVVDYEPSLVFYSSSQLKDTVNQTVSLTGTLSYVDWLFSLNQNYTVNGNPDAQTATQTTTQTFVTGLTASYRFNSLISLDSAFNQNITSADQFTSSTGWTATEYLNFQVFPTLTTSAGVIYGYDLVSVGSDMSYEQLQGRINWSASRRINLSVHAGVEDRQFIGAGIADVISPTFGLTIQYAVTPNTSFSLEAERGITPSILYSQASENTTLTVTYSQTILKHFSFGLTGNYSVINYLATVENLSQYEEPGQNYGGASAYLLVPNRTDTAYGVNAHLDWNIRRHLTFSLTYSYNKDTSSAAGLSYATGQEGFQVGYHF